MQHTVELCAVSSTSPPKWYPQLFPSPVVRVDLQVMIGAGLPLLAAGLQALFEQAVSEKCGQHFPLLWRCYMSYELHRGRPDAARRILLRAVHTCPGAKALWVDGLHFLAEQVSS